MDLDLDQAEQNAWEPKHIKEGTINISMDNLFHLEKQETGEKDLNLETLHSVQKSLYLCQFWSHFRMITCSRLPLNIGRNINK